MCVARVFLCRSVSGRFTVYISGHNTKTTYSKIRVAYNNVYQKVVCVYCHDSAKKMFVTKNILIFVAFTRKSIITHII